MIGLDGVWDAYAWPYYGAVGNMRFAGFDQMKNGDSRLVRMTMHRRPHEFGYSITSEFVDESTWVIEP